MFNEEEGDDENPLEDLADEEGDEEEDDQDSGDIDLPGSDE